MSYDPQPGGGTVAVKDDGTTTVGTATALNFVDTGSLQFVVTDLGAGVAQVVGNVLASGGPPTGSAGGDLAGSTYPNPVVAAGVITDAKLANMTARSLKGRAADSTGVPGTISGAGAGTVPIDGGGGSTVAFGTLTRLLQNLTLEGDISPAQITADQNDYNPASLSTSAVLRLDEDAARAITGIAGGSDGRILILFNIGAFNLTLTNASASSTAANRFDFGRDVVLQPKNAAFLWYDSTSSRWRLVPGEAVDAAAATASLRTLGSGAAQACAGNDSRLSDSRAPTGSAGGDLAGSTYPNPVVANAAITYAKIQNLGALAIMGRSANSSGVGADIQATAASAAVLRESGSTIGFGTIATAGITDAAVTYAKIQNIGARSIPGRSANSSGVGADIAGGGAATFLSDNATTLAFRVVSELPQNFILSGDISPTQITANQNDYNPTNLATSSTLRLTTDANRTITGIAGGADGVVLKLLNVGSFPITLADANASSTAANRFSFGFNVALLPGRALEIWYDSTSSRWRRYNTEVAQIPQTLTDAATITWQVDNGPKALVTLGGNRTVAAPTGVKVDGMYIELAVYQDGTGSRTIAFTTGAGGMRATELSLTQTLSTAAGKCDYFLFRYNSTDDRWDLMSFRKAA